MAAFCRHKPTLNDCAAFFKCSPDTIENRIKEATSLSFSVFREQNMVHTRFSIVQTAIKKAQKGDNVMLIFCLKNLCGWLDRPNDDGNNSKSEIKLTYNTNHEPSTKLKSV